MMDETRFCTFFLDGLFFGIEVERVQEVFRYQQMTRVPRAANVVAGLINLRGQIVTALDLRRRLELRPRPEGDLPMNIVLQSDDLSVSLLVDDIGDVVEVTSEAFEASPETLSGVARELILGAYKLADRLLLILDTDKAATIPASGSAA